jgi:hypothetical protein
MECQFNQMHEAWLASPWISIVNGNPSDPTRSNDEKAYVVASRRLRPFNRLYWSADQ